MKVFDLQCANGHVFEGWFKNENDFVAQKDKGLLTCPVCDTTQVFKILSPFAIKKSCGSDRGSLAHADLLAKQMPDTGFMADFTRKVSKYIEKNFDDVGCDFAKEAVKIHYGVSEPRNIRGVSTPEEDKMLQEEGVNFVKIPLPGKSDSGTDA